MKLPGHLIHHHHNSNECCLRQPVTLQYLNLVGAFTVQYSSVEELGDEDPIHPAGAAPASPPTTKRYRRKQRHIFAGGPGMLVRRPQLTRGGSQSVSAQSSCSAFFWDDPVRRQPRGCCDMLGEKKRYMVESKPVNKRRAMCVQ